MNYEFYVGDYVETKNGEIGYITEVAFTNEVQRWRFMCVMCKQNDSIISFEITEDSIPKRFNRIGQYDFAEEKQNEIKPLKVSYTNDCFQDMVDKINELVNAINELRENK